MSSYILKLLYKEVFRVIQTDMQMYSIQQVADKYNMSPGFIRKEINSGRIRPHKFGRSVRISAYELGLYQNKMKRSW